MKQIFKNYNKFSDFEENEDSSPYKLKSSLEYVKNNYNKKPIWKRYRKPDSERAKRYWTYLMRFIQSKIGTKYNDAYSEYCKKVSPYFCGFNTRKDWKDQFTPLWGYYVDEEGFIRYKKNYRVIKRTPIQIPGGDQTEYYIVDIFAKQSQYLRNQICETFGSGVWWTLVSAQFIDPRDVETIKEYCPDLPLHIMFKKCVYNGKLIYDDNIDYKKYLKKYKDTKRKRPYDASF